MNKNQPSSRGLYSEELLVFPSIWGKDRKGENVTKFSIKRKKAP